MNYAKIIVISLRPLRVFLCALCGKKITSECAEGRDHQGVIFYFNTFSADPT